MKEKVKAFLSSLDLKENSKRSYELDLRQYLDYLGNSVAWNDKNVVKRFLQGLEYDGQKASSLARKHTALKRFYHFCQSEGWIGINPADFYKRPKAEIAEVVDEKICTVEEITHLLQLPDVSTPSGIRDKAMLELLYGGGLKISELLELKIDDVDLSLGCLRIAKSKMRIIPLGKNACLSVGKYLELRKKEEADSTDNLFLNKRGQPLTRQGAGKILKGYVEKAGLDKKVTFQMLRDSFAAHLVQGGADLSAVKELLGYNGLGAAARFQEFQKTRLSDIYHAAHPRE